MHICCVVLLERNVMNYLLTVKNEKITKRPDIKLLTGNIGTYTISFDFDEHWQGLLKFVSFTNASETYVVEAKNDSVTIPSEILENPGLWSFGVFATNGEDNIKRISSNLLEFEVVKGVFKDCLYLGNYRCLEESTGYYFTIEFKEKSTLDYHLQSENFIKRLKLFCYNGKNYLFSITEHHRDKE